VNYKLISNYKLNKKLTDRKQTIFHRFNSKWSTNRCKYECAKFYYRKRF